MTLQKNIHVYNITKSNIKNTKHKNNTKTTNKQKHIVNLYVCELLHYFLLLFSDIKNLI